MAQDVKALTSVAIASVKTAAGVAIASVKTIAGVDNTSGGGSCDTLQFDNNGSYDDFSGYSFYTYIAAQFTAPSSFTNCKGIVRMDVNGTPPAGTLDFMIYTNNSNNPGTLVGTGSATVNRALLSSGVVQVEFTGLSAALTNGTVYWAVLRASSIDGGGANAARWVRTNSGTILMRGSTDGTNWDGLGTGILNFKLNSA